MKQNFNNPEFDNTQANVLKLLPAIRLLGPNRIRTDIDGWILDTQFIPIPSAFIPKKHLFIPQLGIKSPLNYIRIWDEVFPYSKR